MLAQFRRRRNVGIGIGTVATIVGVATLDTAPSTGSDWKDFLGAIGAILYIGGLGSFFWGCINFAKAKGYSGAWGVLGILWFLGLIVLACFPDRHPTQPASDSIGPNVNSDGADNLRGVGGWLILHIVVLMFLVPLVNIFNAFAEFAGDSTINLAVKSLPTWPAYTAIFWSLAVSFSAVSLYAGYSLWHRPVWRSVSWAVFAWWVLGPINRLATGLTDYLLVGVQLGKPMDAIGILQSVFFSSLVSGLWTWYFMSSRRVRNTYLRA